MGEVSNIRLLKGVATCLLVILVFWQASLPTSAVEQGYVHGIAVDEEGVELRNVSVRVYTSGGALVATTSTGSDGFFGVYLEYGTYDIDLIKSGYAKKSIAIAVQSNDLDIQDIVLNRALKLSALTLSMTASQGDTISIPFTVGNIGEEAEVVEFEISEPEDWSGRILYQNLKTTKVYISPGQSLMLQLDVTVPVNVDCDDYDVSLTAIGTTESSLTFTVLVLPLSDSVIFCQFPGKSVAPGDTVQFQLKLKNPLGAEMRFKISLDSIPANWTASVKSASGEYVTAVILDSNEFVDLVVEVKSPSTAEPGKEYGISVNVESSDGNIMSSLPLNIVLNEIEKDVKITTKFPEVTVEAGELVQYPITIANLGGTDTLLLLSAEPPAEWKTAFKSGTLEVSRLYLEAGKSENLVIEATPPSTANIGTYEILVQVGSEDGVIYAMMKLKATIVGSYALSLKPSTLLTSITTGGSVTFTASITNTGSTSITGVRLGIEAPEEWESSITPTIIEKLEPLESFTFTLVVKAPEDTVAGDYLITLKGLSDQVTSDSVQVRVTATTPTSWGLIGVGIAVVVVIALVLVFMKLKRR